MAEFFNAISAVLIIFLIMSVGYLLGKLGWLTASEKRFISKYVVNIAVPVNCVVGILKNFAREDLLHAGRQLLVGVTVVGLTLVLSGLVGKVMGLPRDRWGVFVAMAAISNTMFIGLPVTQQLFGSVSLPYMMVYFLASSMYTQTAAVMLCEHAGGKSEGGGNVLKMLLGMFKKPPVIGICLAVTLLLLELEPPALILTAAGYISNTVTPMALIYCGFILYEVGMKNLRMLPGLPVFLLIRLVLAPALCLGVCMLLGVTGLARDVSVVMAGLPAVTQVTVMAGAYGADERYAAVGSCLSMLGVFITIPIMMVLL